MVPVWIVWFLIIFHVMIGAFSLGAWIRNVRAGKSYWLYVTWLVLACIGTAGGIVLLFSR